ncbi:hypothetical protein HPB51_007090 [Rhipicephalus microplus]|uniref:Tick transposon n=1 Tax=Rhipicephalus microplus TaxID=6941 RepID=A0A9J6DZR8_RHIMP|nr:hypothetical protein HPB51_007090 [Rhipicephalus microplus]
MSPRGKYRTLPLKEKLAAIQEVDAGVKKTEVALKYGITKSTLTTILKAKDKLQNNASRFAPDRKRLREAAYPDLENAVLLWLKRARSSNLPINGPILREKAEELSLRLGIEDFKCSDGWISRFKERHGLSFKTTEGDDESQVLSALKAHNIAADLDSYAATDDNLCVCREDTLHDLVAEVLPAQHSSESEEEPEVENVTTAQAFQYIAKVSSVVQAALRPCCRKPFISSRLVSRKMTAIENAYEAEDFGASRKRLRAAKFPELESALIIWVKEMRAQSIALSGPIIVAKDADFALRLDIEDFVASEGWFHRFRERHNLVFCTLSDYVEVDTGASVCGALTDEDIIAQVAGVQPDAEEPEGEEDESQLLR